MRGQYRVGPGRAPGPQFREGPGQGTPGPSGRGVQGVQGVQGDRRVPAPPGQVHPEVIGVELVGDREQTEVRIGGLAGEREAGATGARSRISTQTREVPSLDYINLEGDTRAVRFDGFDETTNTLIDRKLGVATTEKTQGIAINQSMALEQNGYNGRWEVGTQLAANRASRMLSRLNITNIDVQVVAP